MPNLHSFPSIPSLPQRLSAKRLITRALMAAALLGGTGAALSAGSAQAAWTNDPGSSIWTFPSDNGTCGADCTSDEIIDKIVTILSWDSIPDGAELNFSFNSLDPTPFELDLEFDATNPGQKDFDGGNLLYSIQITNTDLTKQFSLAELRWNGSGTPDPTVTKAIYASESSALADLDPICTLSTDSSTCNVSGRQIWVRDTWSPASGGMDNVSNDYAQTSVPGPLPLMGAGMAFGFSRKLRSRIQGKRATA